MVKHVQANVNCYHKGKTMKQNKPNDKPVTGAKTSLTTAQKKTKFAPSQRLIKEYNSMLGNQI